MKYSVSGEASSFLEHETSAAMQVDEEVGRSLILVHYV